MRSVAPDAPAPAHHAAAGAPGAGAARPAAPAQVTRPARAAWAAGFGQAVPVMLGYVPVAFAFGVLGHTAGLPWWAMVAMSAFVYGGSSQFAALQLLAVGAAPYAIVLTTFVVNLRHLLLSAAIAPRLAGWRRREQALFAYELTDEAFAVHSAQYAERTQRPKAEVFTFNTAVHASWVAGTLAGVLAGDLVTDVEALGLDYALPAMFMALLAAGIIADRRGLAVAVVAGGGAVGLTLLGLQYWAVLVAAAVAATFGLAVAPRESAADDVAADTDDAADRSAEDRTAQDRSTEGAPGR
ncbi:AzlC family ABC transporter permease [Streptomyces sp. NBC_00320]|uniref:AzlC family ABC transporter permease n=1 Tax=Streptomyces sp. NBC_00320 TaxID=2975711 RepID=UPI002254CFF5|nr:AzlC family ABC transporter permease [Streptomyces sp. NBC_00320]MCX5146908.1 AzlC family ABC transporter permease [Streptomyces sp. NBC_00320]